MITRYHPQEVAASLGVRYCADGIVATGTPMGTPEFVAAHAQAKSDAACSMLDTLMELPLPGQDQLLLLRSHCSGSSPACRGASSTR